MGYPAGYPGACSDCGTRREVSGTYDAVFCPLCDEWQSPLCGRCSLCRERPERPSQAPALELTPHERDPDYNLDLNDEDELLRRVVMPVVQGTLPTGVVTSVEIVREERGCWPLRHWPRDVVVPDSVYCRLTFDTGEQETIFLGCNGFVDPEDLAGMLAEHVEDGWAESKRGWGQQLQAVYQILPPAPDVVHEPR